MKHRIQGSYRKLFRVFFALLLTGGLLLTFSRCDTVLESEQATLFTISRTTVGNFQEPVDVAVVLHETGPLGNPLPWGTIPGNPLPLTTGVKQVDVGTGSVSWEMGADTWVASAGKSYVMDVHLRYAKGQVDIFPAYARVPNELAGDRGSFNASTSNGLELTADLVRRGTGGN